MMNRNRITPMACLLMALLGGAGPLPGSLLGLSAQAVEASATGDTLGEVSTEVPPPEGEAQTPPEIPEDRAQQDRKAQEALEALYSRIPGLEAVGVRVDAGIAFLTGTVLSLDDANLARSLAQGATGIIYVDDRIREETSLRSRLGPMWERTWGKLVVAAGYVPLLLLAALIVVVFFLAGSVVARWNWPFRRWGGNPFLQNLLRQLSAGVVGLLGILLALELLDATALVGAVLGAAGVMGVAVGFAFRNIAENYLAGILLSLRQPFAPDDHIVVEGKEGKVVRLTSRETILMTMDGNHVRIPNAMVFNSVVLNYTRNPLRRFSFDLSVGQDQDLVKAQELGVGALRAVDGTLADPPPRSSVVEVGDSWVLLRFFAWVDQSKVAFDKVRSGAIRVVKESLDAGGISLPAPEYGLRMLSPVSPPMATDVMDTAGSPTGDSEIGAGPGWEDEAASPPALPTDVSLEDGLDRQIARDREQALERDLLEPDRR